MSEINVVQPEESDFFVESIKQFQVEDVGSKRWLELHEILIKLNQQAILEASEYREEVIKELFISHNKLPCLVHEAYCVLVWRTKIFPRLLEREPNPKATFFLYTVLYHEAVSITLLEVILYHQNGCESLQESALDLVDYCAQAITQLIGLTNIGYNDISDTAAVADEQPHDELKRLQQDLTFKIGMKCLTILSYLIDKLPSLMLSATGRMVKVHDIPCLISEILHCRPWLRRGKVFQKFIDDKWIVATNEDLLKITKVEAQTWFCLRQLIFNKDAMENYEINSFRQRELAKCTGLLNDQVLDQLPPLAELKQYLCTLQLTGSSKNMSNKLLLEEVPEIRYNIIYKAKRASWTKIVEKHARIFLNLEQSEIVEMAKRLHTAYNTDLLIKIEEGLTDKTKPRTKPTSDTQCCEHCSKPAEKKCSRCQKVFYCSRDCQIKNWNAHKAKCHAAE